MYIFQINEWREKDVIKCEGKNWAWKKYVPYFYAVQIFCMPGVLVNEIWYGISQCMHFIPFNYDNNKILANAAYAMPIDKNNSTQWHVL